MIRKCEACNGDAKNFAGFGHWMCDGCYFKRDADEVQADIVARRSAPPLTHCLTCLHPLEMHERWTLGNPDEIICKGCYLLAKGPAREAKSVPAGHCPESMPHRYEPGREDRCQLAAGHASHHMGEHMRWVNAARPVEFPAPSKCRDCKSPATHGGYCAYCAYKSGANELNMDEPEIVAKMQTWPATREREARARMLAADRREAPMVRKVPTSTARGAVASGHPVGWPSQDD